MRLLHTSDWHLGRSFHREDLLPAQGAFIDFLIDTVRAESVDVVAVAGDLYDRALPPVDAVALCNEALRRLADAGCRAVLISGNHDSAQRLGFAADLIDAAGVHFRTAPERLDRPVLLSDRHGPVAVYGIPYLEPDAVMASLGCPERSHGSVMRAALARIRTDLERRSPTTRSIVLAHAFVSGGVGCESERDLSVGGVASVPLATFAGIDYSALGHLHGAQTLADGVRYSGSPLPFSFSERHQSKSVWLVELEAAGLTRATRIPCPVQRPLTCLRGRLDDLLAGAAYARFEDHYLHITVTDAQRPRDPMERLRARFAHTMVLAFDPEGALPTDINDVSYAARLRGLDDFELSTSFVQHVRAAPATAAERDLLRAALEAARAAEAVR